MTERHPIEGTPFTIIKDKENWFMVMGDYKITETTKTKEEQLDKLETEKWLLIMHIAIIALKKIKKEIDYEEGYNEGYKQAKEYHQFRIEGSEALPQTNQPYETESL